MRGLTILLCLTTGLATNAAAQEARPYTFLWIAGGDTAVSEVVTPTATGMRTDLTLKSSLERFRSSMDVGPDQRVRTITTDHYWLPMHDTVPDQWVVVRFLADSARAEVHTARVARTLTRPTGPDALPWVKKSATLLQQILRRARVMGGKTDTVPVFVVMSGTAANAVVTWSSADSAIVVQSPSLEVHVAISPEGALLGATIPALNTRLVRLSGVHPLELSPEEIAAVEKTAAPGEDPAITKLAQEWWTEFSSGKIDRSQLTERADKNLTDARLARVRVLWGALGTPESWIFKGKRESRGVTEYSYRVTFPDGRVRNVTMALTADGKLAGYTAIPR